MRAIAAAHTCLSGFAASAAMPANLFYCQEPPPRGNSNKNKGGSGMSRALSVYHGCFGRATLYELNRPMTTHAHREGHLIFYVGGGDAPTAPVSGVLHGLTDTLRRRGQPWEPHAFNRRRRHLGRAVYLVLYIDQSWFQRMGRFGHAALRLRPIRDRDDAAHSCDGARSRVAARRFRYRGEFRRDAVRADRCLLRAVLAGRRGLAALLRARRHPSSTSGCANRSC